MGDNNHKKAILAVSFGTSYLEGCKAAIGAIEEAIRNAFPEWELRRAFTSQVVLKILRDRDHLQIEDVKQAMDRLFSEGYQEILVQPTHIMHGFEYEKLAKVLQAYQGVFSSLLFGEPLLSSTKDYQNLALSVDREFHLTEDTALILMGHGSSHFANAAYAALAYQFQILEKERILVGTVEGFPGISELVHSVSKLRVKKLILTPLMVVAGDHAHNDLAGIEETSWKSVFEKAGYEVSCILKGLGEYPSIQALYIEHIKDVLYANQGLFEKSPWTQKL